MKVDTYKCDICGIQKQDANHWFRAFTVPGGAIILTWDAVKDDGSMPSFESTPGFFVVKNIADICGADCVTQWLSRNLL